MAGIKVEGVTVVSLTNGSDIEVGVVVDTAAVVVASNTLDVTGELAKSEGVDLRAREEGRVEDLAVGVVKRSEDVLDSVDLSVAKTPGVVLDVAVQGASVEVADSRVLNNAIGDTVKSGVTLLLDLGLNKNPLVLGQESSITRGTSQLDEASAPALKVLEIGRSSTGDDAIEVARIVLSRVETLSTTGGAANVVGVGSGGTVVLADDLLANLDGSVASTVSPVNNPLVVVQHPCTIERRAVVASVVANGSKTKTRDVGHVDVVDATVEATVVGAHGTAIVVITLRKPDLHVGGRDTAGLNVHGNLANVDLGGERVATLSVGLAIGSVDGLVCRKLNTLKAVDGPVAGGEAVAESLAVAHGCGIEVDWGGCRGKSAVSRGFGRDPINERLKLVDEWMQR